MKMTSGARRGTNRHFVQNSASTRGRVAHVPPPDFLVLDGQRQRNTYLFNGVHVRRAVQLRGNHRQLPGVVVRQQVLPARSAPRPPTSGCWRAARRSQSAAAVTAPNFFAIASHSSSRLTNSMMARPAPRSSAPCPENGAFRLSFQFSVTPASSGCRPRRPASPDFTAIPAYRPRPARRGFRFPSLDRISNTSPSATVLASVAICPNVARGGFG